MSLRRRPTISPGAQGQPCQQQQDRAVANPGRAVPAGLDGAFHIAGRNVPRQGRQLPLRHRWHGRDQCSCHAALRHQESQVHAHGRCQQLDVASGPMFDVLEQCPPDQCGIIGAGIVTERGQDCSDQGGIPVHGSGADIAIACKPRTKPFKAFGTCCGLWSRLQGFDPAGSDQMLEEPANFRQGSRTGRMHPLTMEHPRNRADEPSCLKLPEQSRGQVAQTDP